MDQTSKKIPLHYDVSGDLQAGIPVLYLHGWGCNLSFFAPFRQAFPSIALDFPGHGASPEPENSFSVGDFGEQVLTLLDALNIPRVHIVAHSFGGRVALYLSAHYPERIGKMVLTGAAGLMKEKTPEQQKKQNRYRQIQSFLNSVKKFGLLRPAVEALQKKLQKKHASPDYLALSDSMKETFKLIVNEDLAPLLPQVRSSTLLIWGSNDTETPLWMGQKMEKEIPDAALVVFEGRSHFAFLEEKERFLVILQAFFKEEVPS